MKAIILAAGVGKRLRSVTREPKCLIKINGEPLIARIIRLLNGYGINDIIVITGYKHAKVAEAVRSRRLKAKFIINDDFKNGSIISLWRAAEELKGDTVIMDADLYFEGALVESILRSRKSNFFLIDTKAIRDKEAVIVGFNAGRAVELERGLKKKFRVSGEWAGFLKLSGKAAAALKAFLGKRVLEGERKIGYEFIIPELFKKNIISYELIDGLKWAEIDFPADIKKAMALGI